VTLILDKQRYGARDTVVVTITNRSAMQIWAEDHQTNCTVLVVERAQDGRWDPMANCHLQTPTRLMPLSSGATPVRLDTSGWSPGTNQVTLTYSQGDEGQGGPVGIAHSAEFTLG
jgi:hypothetical protein